MVYLLGSFFSVNEGGVVIEWGFRSGQDNFLQKIRMKTKIFCLLQERTLYVKVIRNLLAPEFRCVK